jgi:hypothetical protein
MAACHRELRLSHFAAGIDKPTTLLAIRAIVGETQDESERLAMPMRTAFKLRRKDNFMLPRLPSSEEGIKLTADCLPRKRPIGPLM